MSATPGFYTPPPQVVVNATSNTTINNNSDMSTATTNNGEVGKEGSQNTQVTTTEVVRTTETTVTPKSGTPDPSKGPKKETNLLSTNTKGLHTVFIHKLYNMLEDEDLKHLIWWTPSNESFVITPGEEFSRALSQYFKHTNVASFVRQLNMYGFHKVSDGSQTVSNSQAAGENGELTLWEFRHSSGSFRKGDIDGLKSIKRRSSKHSSSVRATTTHLEPGVMSDTEISSERSNSVTDYPTEPTGDSMLNVRLSELGHNLASLRHEHARLQLRYDTAIVDMRKTNLDMVYLLDIMQKLIQSNNAEDEHRDPMASPRPHQLTHQQDDMASPGSVPKPKQHQAPYNMQELEKDIARFRATIIQRAATKDQFEQFSVPFAPSYQLDQPQKPRGQFPQTVVQPPSGTQSPADSSAVNEDPSRYPTSYPYPYPYPYPPQFQPYPYPQQAVPGAPAPTSAPMGHLASGQQLQHQHQQQLQPESHQIVHDPFHADRKSSRSSNRSRNMSILCDPLQPSAAATVVSPATSNFHRSSITSEQTGSYFPDARTYNGMQRVYTPEPPHGPVKASPSQRDHQRAGSFPGLAPSVQTALRGEGFMRKRHSSNDATEMRAASNFDNPPRSVPDDGFSQPTLPRKSLSATNITDVRQMDQQRQGQLPPPPPNSGVYALLNPATERRESVSGQQLKKPRMQ